MAQKSDTKKTRRTKNSKEKQKYSRITLALLIIFFSMIALGFAGWGIARVLFSKNKHFILRRVELSGLDSRRSKALTKYLKLTLNKDNLFNIDIAAIRRKVENISYIKSAGIYRVLPDTLKIAITQRVPIAYLLTYNSKWVIDEDSVVMNRKYCMKLKYSLPVIKGFRYRKLKSGEKLADLSQAVNLIKLTTYEFQKFKICSIILENTKKITFIMIKKRRAYKVLIPRKNLHNMLKVLRDALNKKQGKHAPSVDLTYKDLVVFR